MWSKWGDRFKTLGAKRIDFVTSKTEGLKTKKGCTGAKCLLFFDVGDKAEKNNFEVGFFF